MLNNSPFNTFFGLHDEINHFSIVIEIPKIPVVPPISEIWICTFEEENPIFCGFFSSILHWLKRIFFFDDVGEEVEKLFYFQVFVVKEWANFSKVKRVTLMCSNLLRGKPTMSGRVFCLPFWLFLTDFFTPLMRSLFKIDVMGCQIILKVLFCLDLHWSPLTTNKSVGWGRLPLPPRRLK